MATSGVSVVPGLDHLGPEEAARWRRRLDQTAHPCGCKSGAALTLVAAFAWPTYLVASGVPRSPGAAGAALVIYAFVVIAAAVTGKLAGIVVGRWHHRQLRRRLDERLAAIAAVPQG
jgi:hypothetical protein